MLEFKFIVLIQFLWLGTLEGQTFNDSTKHKIKLKISAEGGSSFFVANKLKSASRFPTIEVRIGIGLIKNINNHVDLISGINVGSKIKGERKYPPGSTALGTSVRLGPPFNDLEETVNSRNHHFFEVPLLIQFNLFEKKVGLRTGGSYRNFFENSGYLDSSGQFNSGPDFLSNKSEFGILSGFFIHPYFFSGHYSNINITGNFYFGASKINSLYYSQINSLSNFSYTIRNQYWQVGLEYTF